MNTSIIVQVMNRKELEQLKSIPAGTKIIAISDFGQELPNIDINVKANAQGILFTRFNDVDANEMHSITPEQAQLIKEFIENNIDSTANIIVSCTGGVSRSPGVQAAIKIWLGQDDLDVWNDGSKCPNIYVFEKMLDELLGDKSENIDIRYREDINIKAWKEFNDI